MAIARPLISGPSTSIGWAIGTTGRSGLGLTGICPAYVTTGGRLDRTKMTSATSSNAETIEAWDGPLYDRFVGFREIVTTGLGAHGQRALELFPPQAGQRVLDIGCGFGDTTARIAELVGAEGSATGVDV